MKYRKAQLKGHVGSQAEASTLVEQPGDIAVVDRGVPRLVVMRCPDGCGDILRLNVDRRAGKAWRLYEGARGVSLYPSVWRDTGCESHFILWEDGIYWNDGHDAAQHTSYEAEIKSAVIAQLDALEFKTAEELAEELEAVPWWVIRACQGLARQGLVELRLFGRQERYRRATNRSTYQQGSN